ncbi:MAG: hypothetical protein QOI47_2073 [Actinomycetota bacterium]|nr:hypothetical protein [Actinomycetota bacterium]
MNDQPARRRPQRNRRSQQQANARARKPTDLWRPVPQLPEPEPITPAADPTALLRSLGAPPLPGQGAVAEHYLAAVVERAAGLATALAAAAGLLAMPEAD